MEEGTSCNALTARTNETCSNHIAIRQTCTTCRPNKKQLKIIVRICPGQNGEREKNEKGKKKKTNMQQMENPFCAHFSNASSSTASSMRICNTSVHSVGGELVAIGRQNQTIWARWEEFSSASYCILSTLNTPDSVYRDRTARFGRLVRAPFGMCGALNACAGCGCLCLVLCQRCGNWQVNINARRWFVWISRYQRCLAASEKKKDMPRRRTQLQKCEKQKVNEYTI